MLKQGKNIRVRFRWTLLYVLLSGLLFSLLILPAEAETVASGTCGDNVTWTLDDAGTLTISGIGGMNDYVYEGNYDALPWYSQRLAIKSVIINNGVTSINEGAFIDCDNLSYVIIPNSVTSFGIETFCSCPNLKTAGPIGGGYNIEFGWTSIIPARVFFDCTSLMSVIIPDGVTSIGDTAFAFCWGLTDIVIPETVTNIGKESFYECTSLTSVTIPDNIASIGRAAFFSEYSNLSSVSIPCRFNIESDIFPSETHIIKRHNHIVEDEAVSPTCETCGKTTGSHCDSCGDIVEEQADIDALGHDWDIPVYTWSDDNSSVTAVHVCLRDNTHSEEETVSTTASVTTPATCSTMGQTTFTSYAFANPAFSVQTKTMTNIDALEHQWGAPTYTWSSDNSMVTGERICAYDASHIETETVNVTAEITKPATCTIMGETTYTSSAFSNIAFEVQTKTITNVSALSHTVVTDPAVEPTDTQPGLTEGSHCSVCGEILTAQQNVHPLLWDIDKTDEQATILMYYGNQTNVNIPSSLEGFPVHAIASGAFPYSNCPVRVFIPNSVQSISNTAFGKNVTIYCHEYSEADFWATEVDYTVIYVDNTVSGTFYRITMPDTITMEYGESRELGATVWPLVGGETVTVTSSNPGVVSVNDQTLTAKSVGQATITLTVGGKSASVLVTVHTDPSNFAITDEQGNSDDTFYLVSKKTKQLFVSEVWPQGAEMSITWTSTNESVATVSANGEVTAKRAGQAIIIATAQNGLSRSCSVIVCYPVMEINFEQKTYSVPIGGKKMIKALVITSGGDYINQLVSFTSSDETIAVIDRKGIVKALSVGTITITASTSDGVSADCTLNIQTTSSLQHILSLPTFLTEIESEAFEGLSNVEVVRIPAGMILIAEDAFTGSNVIILTQEGSYAEQWAIRHGFTVIAE